MLLKDLMIQNIKSKLRFKLPRRTNRILTEKKESSNNDPTWYNLYSDGWCEQGGQIAGINNSYTTINLSKSFVDTNYTITTSFQSSSALYPNTSTIGYYSKQQSDFKLGARWIASNETPTAISWRASGYTSTTVLQYLEMYLN